MSNGYCDKCGAFGGDVNTHACLPRQAHHGFYDPHMYNPPIVRDPHERISELEKRVEELERLAATTKTNNEEGER